MPLEVMRVVNGLNFKKSSNIPQEDDLVFNICEPRRWRNYYGEFMAFILTLIKKVTNNMKMRYTCVNYVEVIGY